MTSPIARPSSLLSPPARWALWGGFVTLLALPTADWVLALDPSPPPQENRVLAAEPLFPRTLTDLLAWPASYDAWFKDHLGLRNTLIAWHSTLMLDVLGISPNKDVLIGRDGWLYLGHAKNVDAYRCVAPFTAAELAATREHLVQRRDWLRKRGIAYANLWVPIKANVYPEFLPVTLRKLDQPCRLSQWAEHLRKHSDVAALDLTPAMLRAKRDNPGERLYYKTDTHWNARGAWVGYRAVLPVLRTLTAKLAPIDPARVTFADRSEPGGDLARLMDMPERFRGPESATQLRDSRAQPAPVQVAVPKGVVPTALRCPSCGTGKVLVFHDSFGNHLRPFLAETFGEYLGLEFAQFDEATVLAVRPDLVMEIHLERQMTPDR
ncbi:MAG: hypothetical protein FJ100_19550 [Deltaproteobacteria bacterium]|nr:hypothetical protein [Deltaproteobacteria bacterium]